MRNTFRENSRENKIEKDHSDSASTGLSDKTLLTISFTAEAGKQMLESSTSVSEVLDRLQRFLPAVGLDEASLDATISSLTLSYWRSGQPAPITTIQKVENTQPRLEIYTGTVSLLDRVERGEIELAAAYEELRNLQKIPGLGKKYKRVAILVSVLGWVLLFNGLTIATVLVALLGTLLTFPIDSLVSRFHLPNITVTVLSAIVLAAVPNLLAATGLSFSLSAAVVGGLFVFLPGRDFVSAVIDGLNNVPISGMSRGANALIKAGALALGMIIGSGIGTGLGVELTADTTAAPVWLSVLGAAIGVLGLAVAWGMPRKRVMPSVAIGAVGWLIVALTSGEEIGWAATFGAAVAVGFFGMLVAYLQGGSASIYTGVAIMPLVPGFTLYQAMVALTTGTGGATEKLIDAIFVSIAIAFGAAVGLSLGRNLRSVGTWITVRRDSSNHRRDNERGNVKMKKSSKN